ncbi:uncharacterized protein [Argopecten irradians]|uniref:uncharacterized protein n=1 Tax=Argopecten irradians TaxID=31199 RepID=UPI003712F15A
MGQKAKKRSTSSGVRGVSKVSAQTAEVAKSLSEPSPSKLPLGVVVLVGLAVLFALVYPQFQALSTDRTARDSPELPKTEHSTEDIDTLQSDVIDEVPAVHLNDPMIDEDSDSKTERRSVPLTSDDNGEMHKTKRTISPKEEKTTNPSIDNSGSSQGKKVKSSKPVKTSKSTKKGGPASNSSKKQNVDTEQKLPKEVRDFKPTFQKTMTPKKIFADGRRLPPMELLPQKPNNSSVRVFLYNEFLSDAECDGLMKVHDRHVAESNKNDPFVCFDSINTLREHLKANGIKVKVTPQDFMPKTLCMNATFSSQLKSWFHSNWSYSTAFYPGESRFSKVFEYRVKEATGLLPENGGKFQITSYPLGIGYKTHTDCTENTNDLRDRMGTILVYLQDVEEGGETMFPELGIWVKPKKGRALVWNNMNEDGKCEPMSIHKAAKVDKGHKYILQRWYYYKSFYSLGKRPPEPEIPRRAELQGRVSCDEYQHGSCRWYDEWNYDHLVDYMNKKATLI